MSYTNRSAPPPVNRLFTPSTRAGVGESAPAVIAPDAPAHQGRGNAALYLADQIGRAATPVAREDITPEMEPHSPSLTDEESDEDFDENEDVTPELEPNDPSIESARKVKATVTGDDQEITITAEEGEVLDASEVGGDVIVHVEDEDAPAE